MTDPSIPKSIQLLDLLRDAVHLKRQVDRRFRKRIKKKRSPGLESAFYSLHDEMLTANRRVPVGTYTRTRGSVRGLAMDVA